MKVLLINNFHYHRGGAERAYFDTIKILQSHGHEVAHFSTKHPKNLPSKWDKYFVDYYELSDEKLHSIKGKLKIVQRIWYNFEARRKLKALLDEFKPDVAHLHNIFHHLSPSVIDELSKQSIPTVVTFHDFQFVCPNNILFANGKIWEASKGGKFYRCVSDKCVHGSYAKSFICMVETYLHKYLGILKKADVLTAPSNFLREKSTEFGFDKKIVKLPNPIVIEDAADDRSSAQWGKHEKYILFVGRLSEEKGLDILLRAIALLGRPERLYAMGDGPQKNQLEKLANRLGISKKVMFLPYDKKLHGLLTKGAELAVSPSKCYENAPYGVLDAMALKKLVICANLGGSKEIVQHGVNGLLFEPNDHRDLADKISYALDHPVEREQMALNGFCQIKENFDQKTFYKQLKKIYQDAIRIVKTKESKED